MTAALWTIAVSQIAIAIWIVRRDRAIGRRDARFEAIREEELELRKAEIARHNDESRQHLEHEAEMVAIAQRNEDRAAQVHELNLGYIKSGVDAAVETIAEAVEKLNELNDVTTEAIEPGAASE